MLFLAHSEATAVAASAEARDSQTVMEMTAFRSCACTNMYDTNPGSVWNVGTMPARTRSTSSSKAVHTFSSVQGVLLRLMLAAILRMSEVFCIFDVR